MRNPDFEHINDDECRQFQAAVELAGRKWNAAILLAGARGARRFSEYRESIDEISDRLLSARLRELELDGLMARQVTPTTPVMISYTPTEDGLRLIALMHPLVIWSRDRADRNTHAQSA